MSRWAAAIVLAFALVSSALYAQGYAAEQPIGASSQQRPAYLAHAGISQRLGSLMPMDATFTDETGQTAPLRQWFHGRPFVFAEVYYRCAMLCPQVLHGLANGLKQTTLQPGKDYDVLVFSIDPMDKPSDAMSEKNTFLHEAGWDGNVTAARAVHFLTAQQGSIDAITGDTGFHYVRVPGPDGKMDQFAHSSVILFATPDGHVSKYLSGIDYPPRDLRLALLDASQHRISNPVDLFILYCCNYSPSSGRYTVSVLRVLAMAGLASVLALVGMLYLLTRKPKQKTA